MRLLQTLAILSALTTADLANAAEMQSFELNGYQLAGAEYWPFVENEPFAYPDDVLWGFYPQGATSDVKGCATTSFRKLKEFFGTNWTKMQRVVELGATNRFFLWTNDYSEAASGRARRPQQMWHWNSGTHDYELGYWKWEATLTQDGTCLVPETAQIESALDAAIEALD